jgi:quinoprotein glucose dehydrogenase
MGPLFTPPSREGTILLPGWIGGAGWGGGAFDPETATLFVKGSNLPILARLTSPAPDGKSAHAEWLIDPKANPSWTLQMLVPTRTGLLRRFSHDVPMPIIRPPYGTLTAFDLNKGEIRWQVPLGDTPEIRFHPALRGLKLPPLGVAGAPGPLITRSGLIVVTGGGRTLYAMDAATGAVLWSTDLGRIGYANPMTYRTAQGRQYVVIATGIRDGARLRAFALPDEER